MKRSLVFFCVLGLVSLAAPAAKAGGHPNLCDEPGEEPDITRGTLEGQLAPSDVTIYRLQSTASGELMAYIAQGEVLDIDPQSFGGIGVFAIDEMGRFYRYALLEKEFPHHTAVVFRHSGKALHNIFKLLGVNNISVNLPQGMYYPEENPFK